MQKRIWVLLLSALVTSVCAFADTAVSTEWTIVTNGTGTFSFGGLSTDPLVGTNIQVSNVESADSSGTPIPTDAYTILNSVVTAANPTGNLISDGLLDFTSGSTAASNLTTWSWTGGGSVDLYGCLSSDGTTCISGEIGTTLLVSDSFSTVSIESVPGGSEASFGDLSGTLESHAATALGVSTSFVSPALPAYGMDDNLGGLPSTIVSQPLSAFSTPQGQGTLDLISVPEEWSLSSTLGMFVFGFAVFGVARRLGLIKAIAF